MKKTAVVTGSSRGIGFAIAKQLGMDGYNIVMVATGLQEKNQAALDELQALGIACAYVQAPQISGIRKIVRRFWMVLWLHLAAWMYWSTMRA